jgi:4-carboxymuconolactone decarboxylase
VTVISLMSSGVLDSSLRFHLQTAKENGITQMEIAEAVTHAAFYVGWPKAWAVFNMAKEIWK